MLWHNDLGLLFLCLTNYTNTKWPNKYSTGIWNSSFSACSFKWIHDVSRIILCCYLKKKKKNLIHQLQMYFFFCVLFLFFFPGSSWVAVSFFTDLPPPPSEIQDYMPFEGVKSFSYHALSFLLFPCAAFDNNKNNSHTNVDALVLSAKHTSSLSLSLFHYACSIMSFGFVHEIPSLASCYKSPFLSSLLQSFILS